MANGQKDGAGIYVLKAWSALVLLFLLGPIAIIVIVSFDGSSALLFPPPDWTIRWYSRFLGGEAWRASLWVSVQVGLITTVLATTLGFMAALSLIRGGFRRRMLIYGLLLTPMIVPNIISSIAFYVTFAKLGASGSILGIALGHTVIALPIVVIVLTSNLQSLDERYEHAAFSLGAGHWYTMRRVTLPLAAPGLVSAALFAFLASFDELLIALFLSGIRAQTLTVTIWNSLHLQIEPTIAAVSTCLIGVVVAVLGINAFLRRGA
jgi:putative spermidine/putrescine transport system permease protein